VKDSKIDPERLAALIDGKLTGAERDEVIAQLARSDEAYDVFVDAADVVRELEDEDQPARTDPSNVVPFRPALPWWRRGSTRLLALAAGLVGIAALSWTLMPRLASRNGNGDWPVALLSDGASGLPQSWTDVAWPRTRASTEVLTDHSRAVRIGARLVDLELALRKPDQRAAGFAEEIASLMDGIPVGAASATWYRSIAQGARQGSAPPANELSTMRASTESVAGPRPARLGAWAETARIAAMRRDASFFSSEAFRADLERALAVARTKPAAESLPSRLTPSSIEEAGAPDWDARVEDLTLVVRVLGS
jgi:hypothetical protein